MQLQTTKELRCKKPRVKNTLQATLLQSQLQLLEDTNFKIENIIIACVTTFSNVENSTQETLKQYIYIYIYDSNESSIFAVCAHQCVWKKKVVVQQMILCERRSNFTAWQKFELTCPIFPSMTNQVNNIEQFCTPTTFSPADNNNNDGNYNNVVSSFITFKFNINKYVNNIGGYTRQLLGWSGGTNNFVVVHMKNMVRIIQLGPINIMMLVVVVHQQSNGHLMVQVLQRNRTSNWMASLDNASCWTTGHGGSNVFLVRCNILYLGYRVACVCVCMYVCVLVCVHVP